MFATKPSPSPSLRLPLCLSSTVRRLHLRPSPLCASLFASSVLSCDNEKPKPQILCLTPSLLAIKFSHSDQRRRQLAGIVAELAGTMAENGVAIPSLLVPP